MDGKEHRVRRVSATVRRDSGSICIGLGAGSLLVASRMWEIERKRFQCTLFITHIDFFFAACRSGEKTPWR
jgi:hypothetical protein